jgi:hypothetical protein
MIWIALEVPRRPPARSDRSDRRSRSGWNRGTTWVAGRSRLLPARDGIERRLVGEPSSEALCKPSGGLMENRDV